MKKTKEEFFLQFLEKNVSFKEKIKDVHIHENNLFVTVANKYNNENSKFIEEINLFFPHFNFDKIYLCEEYKDKSHLFGMNCSGATSFNYILT